MKKENIKTGHFRGSLSEISLISVVYKIKKQLSSLTKAEAPRQQPSGMTSLFYNGFTLIELLVVVLIIGILSAIALPQYQKAVEKAKATQALTLLKSVYQAQQAYKTENGSLPSSFSGLSVSIPWTGTTKAFDPSYYIPTLSNEDWSLQLLYSSTLNGVWVTRISGKYQGASFWIPDSSLQSVRNGKLTAGEIVCVELHGSYAAISFQKSSGDYCSKIMNAKRVANMYTDHYFSLN